MALVALRPSICKFNVLCENVYNNLFQELVNILSVVEAIARIRK